jgi:hypothetical protein
MESRHLGRGERDSEQPIDKSTRAKPEGPKKRTVSRQARGS